MADEHTEIFLARATIAAALMRLVKFDLNGVTWTNENAAESGKIRALKAAVDILMNEVVYK